MDKNVTLENCIEALKNFFKKDELQNAKEITTADGKTINVEGDEIKKGSRCSANDGSYTMPDNSTIIVKNGVIEEIEEPKKEETPEPTKKEEGDDEEKKELKEKVKNLTDANADLEKQLADAKAEIEEFQNKKKDMEDVLEKINAAGGIEAVINCASPEPSHQTTYQNNVEGDDEDGYDFIKGLDAFNS